MKQRSLKFTLIFTLLLSAIWLTMLWLQSSSSTALASGLPNISNAFTYQGTLRLADGNLATGSYSITLKLYNVVTAGTALYSESFTDVVVRNGNFSVVVGDATPIDPAVFDNANLYIGITVAPDPEMLPRQRLYPVPWAVQAGQAQSATTATTATIATTLVKNATIDGLIINKGATNDGALRLTSSGPGWGSGVRFENTTANRTYGIYVGQDGIWQFVDETAGANRMYIQPNGSVGVPGALDVNNSNMTMNVARGGNNGGDYEMNVGRYVADISSATMQVDEGWLQRFCVDEDGCSITLAERNWDPNNNPNLLRYYGPFKYSIATVDGNNRRQVVRSDQAGNIQVNVDGENAINDILNGWNTCVFQDYGTDDSGPSLFLRAQPNKSCLLIIED
jgi:hypothetical protein